MPKYLIEREIPEAGKLSAEELQGISQKSCDVLTRGVPVEEQDGIALAFVDVVHLGPVDVHIVRVKREFWGYRLSIHSISFPQQNRKRPLTSLSKAGTVRSRGFCRLMHFGVILREERYLERKFGEVYLQYKTRVRRWL